jgi:hypothetical protein
MPGPLVIPVALAGIRVVGAVAARQFAKEAVKKGAQQVVKVKPPKWQKFDPKGGGAKPTPDYLRPRGGTQAPNTNPYRPDAALPPRVSTPTKPTPTKPDVNPLGPNTKPFDPYSPKTNPWPDMPKVNPSAPKPAPAPRKPVAPPTKAPTKAPTKTPTNTNPWNPKSSTPPKIETPKTTTVTSATTQTQPALQRITKIPGGMRTVAFGTGLAAAGMFMPKAAKGDKDTWVPSAIV